MNSYGGGGGDGFTAISAAAKMEDTALREAASAGIHGVEEFLKLIGQSQPTEKNQTEITAVTDVAVNSFKKVISLLGRSRTGHARFRRAPTTQTQTQTQFKQTTVEEEEEEAEEKKPVTTTVFTKQKIEQYHGGSAFRVYCPTPIHRRPPLSHNSNNQNQTKNGSSSSSPPILANGAPSTINFAPSPPVSATNSFMSSHRCDTDNSTHMSSGFEFTNPSHVSGSRAKPPLSSASLKRRCNSSPSSRCHCSKKRFDSIPNLKIETLLILF